MHDVPARAAGGASCGNDAFSAGGLKPSKLDSTHDMNLCAGKHAKQRQAVQPCFEVPPKPVPYGPPATHYDAFASAHVEHPRLSSNDLEGAFDFAIREEYVKTTRDLERAKFSVTRLQNLRQVFVSNADWQEFSSTIDTGKIHDEKDVQRTPSHDDVSCNPSRPIMIPKLRVDELRQQEAGLAAKVCACLDVLHVAGLHANKRAPLRIIPLCPETMILRDMPRDRGSHCNSLRMTRRQAIVAISNRIPTAKFGDGGPHTTPHAASCLLFYRV